MTPPRRPRSSDPTIGALQGAPLEHDPEKHALGLDPMGGYRFSVKIMLKLNNLDRDPIQLKLDHGLENQQENQSDDEA
jgi:hypothetical protein